MARVDPDQRSDQILAAAVKVLSEGGFVKLTLSNLAKELGGSMRLVTHYYANRPALIDGIVSKLTKETDEVLQEIAAIDSPVEAVRVAVEWFLLPDEKSIREEKVRIALLGHRAEEPAVDRFFDVVDAEMRAVFRAALTTSTPLDLVERRVDFLRVWTSGLALSVIERPDDWPYARQRQAADDMLSFFETGVKQHAR